MWKVFSIKTLYRTVASSEPMVIDDNFRDDIDLVEERIFTIKARNFDEAIAKGEKEAIKYAYETDYSNPYGQKVIQEYIGSINVFELFEEIEANVEIFSSTYIIDSSVTNSEITDNVMGKQYKNESKIRTKFLNSKFS